jgi:hypothetical protein
MIGIPVDGAACYHYQSSCSQFSHEYHCVQEIIADIEYFRHVSGNCAKEIPGMKQTGETMKSSDVTKITTLYDSSTYE